MWEGIGLLLVYLVSGYLNKRKKEEQLRQDENDSIQDPRIDSSNNMNDLLTTFFDGNNNIDVEPDNLLDNEDDKINDDFRTEEITEYKKTVDEGIELEISNKKNRSFEDKIYHSKLGERKEQHLGNKWEKKISLKKELFNSSKMLKKAFILKEILDKPLGLREEGHIKKL